MYAEARRIHDYGLDDVHGDHELEEREVVRGKKGGWSRVAGEYVAVIYNRLWVSPPCIEGESRKTMGMEVT